MRHLVQVLALALVLVAPAMAQQPATFEGVLVFAESGAPVAGALVSIAGVEGTAVTDGTGRFTLAAAPRPPLLLVVVLAGGQVMRPVTVAAIDAGMTRVEVEGFSEDAITVIGAAPSISTSPASATTVLSGTQIARRSPENLMQALETLPGVNQVSEGHAAVPAVRGLARGRTLFLIDGARVTSERRVGPSGTFLDPAIVEGIDVSRGPGSVAYGSDAIGGIVSVRTRQAEPGSPLRAAGTVTFGTAGLDGRGSLELAKGFARGGVLFHAHVRRADDYDSPEGEVFNSGWEDQGFLVHLTRAIGGGGLSAVWQSDYGRDVDRPRNNSRTVRFYYPFENSHRLTVTYRPPDAAGFQEIAVTGFLGAYEQRTDQDRFATATAGRTIERADVAARDLQLRASARRPAGPAYLEFGVDVNGRVGLEAFDVFQQYGLSGAVTSETRNVSVDRARRLDTGMFAQLSSVAGRRLRVAAGVRGDRVTTENVGGYFGDRSTSNMAGSGFGALSLELGSGVSVLGQVARGFRDPTLSDRYFRGPSGRGFITGNPELRPESSLQFDVAARFASSKIQAAVNVYEYKIDDLVERYQTQTDFFFFRNRGRARLRGVEVEARADLGQGLAVDIAAHAARGRAVDDNANLDDISPPTFAVRVEQVLGDRGYAHVRAAVHAEDTRPGPSEVVAPGASIVDVGAGWRPWRQLEVRGLVRNVLNAAYYASPDPRWVLAPGRAATLTTVVKF